MPGLSTPAVLELMRDVAAEIITPRFRALADGEVTEKNPGDLVTVADREAEVAIVRELAVAYPDAVLLGEESHAEDESLMGRYQAAGHAFTIDPIDGTKNFVHHSPDHAVMIAELIDHVVVRSWIYQPAHDVAWVAERGGGVTRDGQPMHTNPPQDGAQPAGVTSNWSLRGHRMSPDLPELARSWACCGIEYPKVIEGATDYVLYGRAMPWDHAPGSLMIEEAGGVIGHPDGTDYSPNETRPGLIVAADRGVFTTVARHASQLFGERP